MLPKDIVTESIRYWEKKRILYNLILFTVTLTSTIAPNALLPVVDPHNFSLWNALVFLPIFAVVANILYCTAYIPDTFIQQSDFKDIWKSKFRPWLFWGGTALAAVFALLMTPFIVYPQSIVDTALQLRA